MLRVFIFCFMILGLSPAYAGLLPDYDKNCDHLLNDKCPIVSILSTRDRCNADVPRIIHRIWFGAPEKLSKENRLSWQDYATQFCYEYHLWTENDMEEFSLLMSPENFSFFLKFVSTNNWWAASDIVRLELIKHFGGIYLDCDFKVPNIDGENVDLLQIVNMRGLTLMCEHHGRNIGSENAVFLANSLISSPPNHTVIAYAADNISNNIKKWFKFRGDYNAMYATGPFYLNRVLNGSYSIVPVTFLTELGVH